MKKALFLLAALFAAGITLAAAAPKPISNQEADLIIQKLEKSGKLDAAVDRALHRLIIKQQEAQRQQQEEAAKRQQQMSENVKKPNSHDHIYGNKHAEVSLIEFSDFECPFCKAYNGTPQEVVKRMHGRVNYIWRYFPLPFHEPMATREAEAAQCVADQGGNKDFWRYTDLVFSRTRSNGRGMPAAGGDPIAAVAKQLKVNVPAFKKCLDSGQTLPLIKADMADGKRSGVSGTPTVIIYNNKTGKTLAITGEVPFETLEAATRKMLKGS